MLQRLEQANLFVVSLDRNREWYRCHAFFAQTLYCQLERTHADLVPILHHRASLWYAEHNQTTQAILHAFKAREWQWAADLIELIPMLSLTSGVGEHAQAQLQQWLEHLPSEVMHSRPRLCLACSQILGQVAPLTMESWTKHNVPSGSLSAWVRT